MPNWNTNVVTIHAPLEEVRQYLVQDDKAAASSEFNMHLLFPAVFPAEDATGEDHWNYEWACEFTGSKWFPNVEITET